MMLFLLFACTQATYEDGWAVHAVNASRSTVVASITRVADCQDVNSLFAVTHATERLILVPDASASWSVPSRTCWVVNFRDGDCWWQDGSAAWSDRFETSVYTGQDECTLTVLP